MNEVVTDREFIAAKAEERATEHDLFREFLDKFDGSELDATVHRLNEIITPQIDCTQCGACCKTLMINVTEPEAERLAGTLHQSTDQFKENYIETSLQGQMVINSIPCVFLSGTVCSIYTDRFEECRQFPHLHKDNFKTRYFGTLMHYGRCPIIFNVIEALKTATGFKTTADFSDP
ncbi:MAG: hypothetical protein JWQ27_521 [Ferruginibacter sp.]|nr:hypothetical protein [Ferruginibacter sp.]